MRTCLKKKGKRQRIKGHCKATEAVRGRTEEAEWHLKGKKSKVSGICSACNKQEGAEGRIKA